MIRNFAQPLGQLFIRLLFMLVIPLLCVLADVMGVLGAILVSVGAFDVEWHYYWQHSQEFVGAWDICNGCSLLTSPQRGQVPL